MHNELTVAFLTGRRGTRRGAAMTFHPRYPVLRATAFANSAQKIMPSQEPRVWPLGNERCTVHKRRGRLRRVTYRFIHACSESGNLKR